MAKKRGYKVFIALTSVLLAISLFLSALCLALLVAEQVAERRFRTIPSYPKEDITQLVGKTEWTQAEYRKLYLQTGLAPSALDFYKGNPQEILAFQEGLFYDGESEHEIMSPITMRDIFTQFDAPIVPLQTGDVVVTASTHTLGWRHGHSAIVVDNYGSMLEAYILGQPSLRTQDGGGWFRECTNFMVLRLKNSTEEQRKEIGSWASANLVDIPYVLTTGIFSKKDQSDNPKGTQCGHLVWQAFKKFGIDLDSNGGKIVTPRDIARSPLLEVVQVYGFDPEKLW